jgi:hypothetical protein
VIRDSLTHTGNWPVGINEQCEFRVMIRITFITIFLPFLIGVIEIWIPSTASGLLTTKNRQLALSFWREGGNLGMPSNLSGAVRDSINQGESYPVPQQHIPYP